MEQLRRVRCIKIETNVFWGALRVSDMPHYDHTCKKCKKNFVVEMKISEVGEKKVPCPKCQSKDVTRNVTNNSFTSESINRYTWDK